MRLFLRGLPMWLLVIGPLAFALGLRDRAPSTGTRWSRPRPPPASGGEFINQLESAFPNVYAAIVVAIGAVGVSVVDGGDPVSGVPGDDAALVAVGAALRRADRCARICAPRTIYGAYLRFLRLRLAVLARRRASSAASHSSPCGAMLATVAKLPRSRRSLGAVGGVGIYVVDDARLFDHLSGHREARALARRRRIDRARGPGGARPGQGRRRAELGGRRGPRRRAQRGRHSR